MVLTRLGALVDELAPELRPWLPLLAVPLDLDPPSTPEVDALAPEFRRARLHESVIAFLRALLTRPTLIECDDAQYLDEASADLFAAVARRGRRRPVARPPAAPRRRSVRGAGDRRRVIRIEPGPLDDAARPRAGRGRDRRRAAQPDAARARRSSAPAAIRSSCAICCAPRHPAGATSCRRASRPPRWRASTASPRTSARSSAAPPFSASASTRASCSTCSATTFRRPTEQTWVRLEPFFQDDGDGYLRFRRVIVRDAAYAGLPYGTRRRLHRAVGERMEREYGSMLEEVGGLLSLHFHRAGEHAKAWRLRPRSRRSRARQRGVRRRRRPLPARDRLRPRHRDRSAAGGRGVGGARRRAGACRGGELRRRGVRTRAAAAARRSRERRAADAPRRPGCTSVSAAPPPAIRWSRARAARARGRRRAGGGARTGEAHDDARRGSPPAGQAPPRPSGSAAGRSPRRRPPADELLLARASFNLDWALVDLGRRARGDALGARAQHLHARRRCRAPGRGAQQPRHVRLLGGALGRGGRAVRARRAGQRARRRRLGGRLRRLQHRRGAGRPGAPRRGTGASAPRAPGLARDRGRPRRGVHVGAAGAPGGARRAPRGGRRAARGRGAQLPRAPDAGRRRAGRRVPGRGRAAGRRHRPGA